MGLHGRRIESFRTDDQLVIYSCVFLFDLDHVKYEVSDVHLAALPIVGEYVKRRQRRCTPVAVLGPDA
jgi:hypothetical protein